MDGDVSAQRKRGCEEPRETASPSHPSSRPERVFLPGTSCLERLEVGFPYSFSFQPGLYPAGLHKAQPLDKERRENLAIFSPALQINNFGHRSGCWIFSHLKLRLWRACFSPPVWLTGWVIVNLVNLHWTRGSKGRGGGLPLPSRVGLRLNSELASQLPSQLSPLPPRLFLEPCLRFWQKW